MLRAKDEVGRRTLARISKLVQIGDIAHLGTFLTTASTSSKGADITPGQVRRFKIHSAAIETELQQHHSNKYYWLESFFLKNPDVLWAIEPTRVTKIIANLRNSEFPPDHSRKILSSHWKNGRDADWLEEHAIEHLLSIAESVVAIDDRIHEDAFSFGFKQLPVLTQEETTYVAQHQDRDELLQLLAKVDARVSRQPRSFSAQLG